MASVCMVCAFSLAMLLLSLGLDLEPGERKRRRLLTGSVVAAFVAVSLLLLRAAEVLD